MTVINNPSTKKTGKMSFSGRDIILYSIDVPQCDTDGSILNDFFKQTAENYEKYLEAFAEKEIAYKLKIMIETSKRSREIRDEIGIPIHASLVWKAFSFKEKYISLKCETRTIYSNSKSIFTVKALTLDTECMILKKAKHFSKKARKKKQNFYVQGTKIYTFDKDFAVCENEDYSPEEILKFRSYKIDNINV
ncbi:MAG: hypothetical protein E7633_09780 [Ruminococcaceae bacterium]|nr:hypothetical protein [Oscillospiraceae bacterium]